MAEATQQAKKPYSDVISEFMYEIVRFCFGILAIIWLFTFNVFFATSLWVMSQFDNSLWENDTVGGYAGILVICIAIDTALLLFTIYILGKIQAEMRRKYHKYLQVHGKTKQKA